MTWVLPNGEMLEVGPSAIPQVGNLPLHYCPGPEINGMFFNADGLFGICTELTAKLYPEPDNVEASWRTCCPQPTMSRTATRPSARPSMRSTTVQGEHHGFHVQGPSRRLRPGDHCHLKDLRIRDARRHALLSIRWP